MLDIGTISQIENGFLLTIKGLSGMQREMHFAKDAEELGKIIITAVARRKILKTEEDKESPYLTTAGAKAVGTGGGAGYIGNHLFTSNAVTAEVDSIKGHLVGTQATVSPDHNYTNNPKIKF